MTKYQMPNIKESERLKLTWQVRSRKRLEGFALNRSGIF